jgi:NADH-quinone oxidoreductase subunit G
VLNARIRKMWLAGRTTIGLVGAKADLGYDYEALGPTPEALAAVIDGKDGFAGAFRNAQRPAIILGQGALARPDGAAVLREAAAAGEMFGVVRPGWNGWNILHTAASRVGGLDMGFIPRRGAKHVTDMLKAGALDVLFLLGADEIDLAETNACVIYLGTHGDKGAHKADIILPGAAYTEKNGLYVNTEGRVQRGERAVYPKGEAREDWAILRALSEHLDARLPYDSLDALRARLFADHPTFGHIGHAPGSTPAKLDLSKLGTAGPLGDAPLTSPIEAFHLTNPIARASPTMAECAALAAGLKMAAE